MTKKILSNHWFWFVTLLTCYTFYDIYEHISRLDSVFEEHPVAWALFSLISQLVMFLVLFGSKWILEKIAKKSYMFIDFLGITIAISAHVYIFGPMINRLVFPHSILTFFFVWILPAMFIALYLVIRGVLFLIQRSLKKST